jgi:hypothetical protein
VDFTHLSLIEIYFTFYFKLSRDTDSYSIPQFEILAMVGMQRKKLTPPTLNNWFILNGKTFLVQG